MILAVGRAKPTAAAKAKPRTQKAAEPRRPTTIRAQSSTRTRLPMGGDLDAELDNELSDLDVSDSFISLDDLDADLEDLKDA